MQAIKHVGWDESYNRQYYDPSVIAWISDAVMNKTMGLDKRPIRVTNRVIEAVLDTHLTNYRIFPGDIHTRYNIPGDGNFSGDFGRIKTDSHNSNNEYGGCNTVSLKDNVGFSSNYVLNEVVQYITEYLTTEYAINTNNKRFSAWSALYGANDVGLRAHSQIKLRERRPTPFQFHMKF